MTKRSWFCFCMTCIPLLIPQSLFFWWCHQSASALRSSPVGLVFSFMRFLLLCFLSSSLGGLCAACSRMRSWWVATLCTAEWIPIELKMLLVFVNVVCAKYASHTNSGWWLVVGNPRLLPLPFLFRCCVVIFQTHAFLRTGRSLRKKTAHTVLQHAHPEQWLACPVGVWRSS